MEKEPIFCLAKILEIEVLFSDKESGGSISMSGISSVECFSCRCLKMDSLFVSSMVNLGRGRGDVDYYVFL